MIVEHILIAGGTVCGFGIGYIVAKWRTRHRIEARLNSLHSAEALAYFLRKEQFRHVDDLRTIQKDLDRLRKLGVEAPDIPLETWVRVPLWETFDRSSYPAAGE